MRLTTALGVALLLLEAAVLTLAALGHMGLAPAVVVSVLLTIPLGPVLRPFGGGMG